MDVLSTLLDAEAPDLAVLNGDLITGENTHLHNSTHYVDAIVAPLVARSVPWASTYGNHDLQFNLSTRALLARERFTGGALSFTRAMVPGDESVVGTSNYYLPVYAADSDEILLLLWFFDSKGGRAFQRQNELNSTVVVPSWVDDSVCRALSSLLFGFCFPDTHHLVGYGLVPSHSRKASSPISIRRHSLTRLCPHPNACQSRLSASRRWRRPSSSTRHQR